MAMKLKRKKRKQLSRIVGHLFERGHLLEREVQWLSRIVGHGEADPKSLMPNPQNRRKQAAFLAAAGFGAVMVNKRTGCIVDGHERVVVALARGETRVPVDYVDLSEDEEKLVLATLEPTGLGSPG